MFNYNKLTKTLIIQSEIDYELVNLPNAEIMIFENTEPNYSKFNQNVNNLPLNLTHLIFGFNFNQNVNKLPPNLTHLTFGDNFNQNVDKLPINLTHLTFGNNFNQNVDNLTFIKCWSFTSKSFIKNNIPVFITKINIIFYKNDIRIEYITNLPPTIQEIKINMKDKIHYLKKNFLWLYC